jgi:acyl CoA:acetate/3-ketoacid CoA transferase beta subunit
MTDVTRGELMAVAASHLIASDEVVVVGLGLPQVAALLAKQTHAPGATLLLELGVFDPAPTTGSMGIADPRMWEGAKGFAGMIDVLGYLLHGGRVTLGILGALQVDAAGTINSSVVVNDDGTRRRFTGSGGGNDIASLAHCVMVVMRHDPRKFRERVDFMTSPGRLVGGRPRAELGLPGSGTSWIVTDRAVIQVGDEGLALASVHAGDDPEAVIAATPLPLAANGVGETARPTSQELRLIREELDPHGWYTA